jgi:hypothetical protein
MKLLYNFICEGKTLICLVGERGAYSSRYRMTSIRQN